MDDCRGIVSVCGSVFGRGKGWVGCFNGRVCNACEHEAYGAILECGERVALLEPEGRCLKSSKLVREEELLGCGQVFENSVMTAQDPRFNL